MEDLLVRAKQLAEVTGPYVDGLERALPCDMLEGLGPEAATVLAPWTTRDLAAHLFLREHDSLAGPGLVVPGPWSRFAERKRKEAMSRDFAELVATIRSGPPECSASVGCAGCQT